MILREAVLDDVPEVTTLALQFFDESGAPYNPTNVVAIVADSIDNPNALVLMAKVKGEIAGIFLAFLDRNVFTDELFSQDRIIFVLPEYRAKPVAYALYKGYLAWARSKHCKEAMFSALWSKDNESLKNVLSWLGCDVKGYLLRKTL
jgi:GNAT superfamily N-acetyltransferase